MVCRAEYVIFLRKKNIFMFMASQVVPAVKNPPADTGDPTDMDSIPGSGRFSGVENVNPLQYSCLIKLSLKACVGTVAPPSSPISPHLAGDQNYSEIIIIYTDYQAHTQEICAVNKLFWRVLSWTY